ncbi:MAG TPA: ATP synthase F1 subunit delta [Bacillota bacterium]
MDCPQICNFAKAMVDLAQEMQLLDEVRQAAEELLPRLNLPEVRQYLLHPLVKADDKKSFCRKLIAASVPQVFINFVDLIIDRRHFRWLPRIMEETIKLAIKAQGYEIITLISAKELTKAETELIRKELEQHWSIRVFLEKRVNPSLIGGIVIQRGDQLYDGSILGKINQLRTILTGQPV